MKEAVMEPSASGHDMPEKEVLDLMETPRSESEILRDFIEGLRPQMASGAIRKVFEKFLENEDKMQEEGFDVVLDESSHNEGSSGYVRINLRIADWFREKLSEIRVDIIDLEKPLVDTFFSDKTEPRLYVKIEDVKKSYAKAKDRMFIILGEKIAKSLSERNIKEGIHKIVTAEKTMKAAA